MVDQADKLRALMKDKDMTDAISSTDDKDEQDTTVKIFSIVSGKGGVGKTNFAVNLGIALHQMGNRVLLVDADIGMSNANILLGVESNLDLSDLLEGRASIEDIITKCSSGIDLLLGSGDLTYIDGISHENQMRLIQMVKCLTHYDIILIDNGAGIDKSSLMFMNFSDEVILITTPEPTAITDGYRIAKAISVYNIKEKVKVVINQIDELSYGDEAFDKLKQTSQHFLSIELENAGYIFYDSKVSRSVMEHIPLIIKYPHSIASKNISQISKNLLEDKSYSKKVSSLDKLTSKIIKFFR